jgi:hypothetical protein
MSETKQGAMHEVQMPNDAKNSNSIRHYYEKGLFLPNTYKVFSLLTI